MTAACCSDTQQTELCPAGRQPFQSPRGRKPWGYSKADSERAVQLSVCPRVGTANVSADGGSLGDLSPPWS